MLNNPKSVKTKATKTFLPKLKLMKIYLKLFNVLSEQIKENKA